MIFLFFEKIHREKSFSREKSSENAKKLIFGIFSQFWKIRFFLTRLATFCKNYDFWAGNLSSGWSKHGVCGEGSGSISRTGFADGTSGFQNRTRGRGSRSQREDMDRAQEDTNAAWQCTGSAGKSWGKLCFPRTPHPTSMTVT